MHSAAHNWPEMVGAVREEVGSQHDLVEVGGQVVVQEQRPVIEEVGQVVKQVAGQQHLAGLQDRWR